MIDRRSSKQESAPGSHATARSPVRVLPCAESSSVQRLFIARALIEHVVWLPITTPALLVPLVESTTPDLILVGAENFSLSQWPDPALLKEIFANIPTILLVLDPDAVMRRASKFGISSVLPLDVTTSQLLSAITATAEGLAVTMQHALAAGDKAGTTSRTYRAGSVGNEFSEHLTGREIEVLRLMANGRSNKQIASLLHISEHTAKFHVSSVLGKLGASSRTEAVSLGVLRGMVAI